MSDQHVHGSGLGKVWYWRPNCQVLDNAFMLKKLLNIFESSSFFNSQPENEEGFTCSNRNGLFPI
jgi:hypothetical protein